MIRNVAVIGAGVAGRDFALRCAQAGFTVTLEDVMPEKLRRAQDTFGTLPVRYALTVEDAVHDADLAIDFVPDELESKLEIFSLLDRMAPPRTILLTPTQTLSITDLATCTYRRDRCLALDGSALVHCVFSREDVVTQTHAFLSALGEAPSVVLDQNAPMLTKNS